MTPGTRNFTKIKCFNFLQFSWPRIGKILTPILWSFVSCFNFLQFSWPWVHETSHKSNASIFSNFHDPGYTKLHKNHMLQFPPLFMTPGTWHFTKIKCFNSSQFLWPIRASELKNLTDSRFFSSRLFSSTHFPATCVLVGNCATKIRLWESQISPGYLFIERFPPHLGVF